MTRKFRFGVQLSEARSRGNWIEQARLAEQLGYDVLVMPDHIGDQLAPFPALVVAAEATERIRLGTFVLDNDFRHPVLVAQEAATVDLLTDGRLELGIGAGWMGRDYERLGIEFSRPRTRYERLTEAVEIINSYFLGRPFSFSGRHYTMSDLEPGARPAQHPRPPLLIGGGGPRILEFAARHADIVSVFLTSLSDGSGFDVGELTADSYQRKTDLVRDAAARRDDPPELNILLQHLDVTNSRNASADERARDSGIDRRELLALPFELIGTIDQIVGDLLERRERYGLSYVTVFDKHLRDFAPIVERLSNT
jgi:probable F420-dependent oxidoreductase